MNSFNVDDGTLDVKFNQGEFSEINNDQKFDIITLRSKIVNEKMSENGLGGCCVKNCTTNCVTDNKGMVRDCLSLFGIPKRGQIDSIKLNIDTIKIRLMSFAFFVTLSDHVQNKYEQHALIDIAKINLSNLDIYWNNIYIVTEELKRQIRELNNSNTVPSHINQEIADMYSTYATTKQRLQSEILRYQNALGKWGEGDKRLMKLEMKFKGFSCNDIADENQKSGCLESESRNVNLVNIATEETIMETPLKNKARFRRMKWIAFTFYLFVIILWLVGWLEPQCCDLQNNNKWSFELGLRYVNGPPPT